MKALLATILLLFGLSGCVASFHVASYDTPEKTFDTWRYAARNLDISTLLSTYAKSARPSIESDLAKSSKEALKSMQDEAKNTDFKIEKIVYEDNLAYLRVLRKVKNQNEVEVLTMIKEGDKWKLLP